MSLQALRDSAPLQALLGGLILGFLCYGTYKMTNDATWTDWSMEQVLTGFSA